MSSRRTATRGYGKKSQDWSYLTPKRALYNQTAVIASAVDVPDATIIDTTVDRKGDPVDRARQQTLVIYLLLVGSATLSKDAVLYLWIDGMWDEDACANPGVEGSSSSNFGCPDVPEASEINPEDRWCLIRAVKLDNNNTANLSLAFSFSRLPAGRYKAAIGVAGALTGEILLVEQHTE